MSKSAILFYIFLLSGLLLTAQSPGQLSLEVQAGVGSFTTYSDFQQTVYTSQGRAFYRTTSNVGESDLIPSLSIELQYQINERWQLAPFIQYQSGSGTLNENDRAVFGVRPAVPVEQVFRSPSTNRINAFTGGLELRYRLARLATTKLYLGTGIAFTYRSHNYRSELEVDFNEDRTTRNMIERFTTEDKSSASIPVSLSIEQSLSDRLTLTLNTRGLLLINLEDRAWAAGIGLRYSL